MNEFSVISEHDGLKLYGFYLEPNQNPCGIVQILHGMCERKERYLPFAEYLANYGYVVVVHDHRGHGQSIRNPEDLGYFYENGAQAVVKDAHQITGVIQEKYPNLPLFLLGHSMGSLIARVYTKRYDIDLCGLILCGSPGKNRLAKPARDLLKQRLAVRDGHIRSETLQKLAIGVFNDSVEDPKSENAWICSEDSVVKAFDDDPLCGFVFTLNGFHTLFTLMDETYQKRGYRVQKQDLPILFSCGMEDPCRISDAELNKAVRFLQNVGYRSVDAKLYGGMRHEVLNESRRYEVWNDILNWLAFHTDTNQPIS